MNTLSFARLALGAVLAACMPGTPAVADYLTPPGIPGSEAARMRTLNEVEPRTIISAIPVTITNSGVYVLVSNLHAVAGSDGITVSASDVTIDLNGFVLLGRTNSHDAITAPSHIQRLTVKNGAILQWGGYAVDGLRAQNSRYQNLIICSNGFTDLQNALHAGTNSIVERCIALQNCRNGLYVSDGGKIEECTSRGNGYTGINAGKNCTIIGCTSTDNGIHGFYTRENCVISQCNAISNDSHGVYFDSNTSISKCAAAGNTGNGFHSGRGCSIVECTAQLNSNGFYVYHGTVVQGCSAYSNTNDGFYGWTTASFKDCSSLNNGDDGFDITDGSRISGCLASGQSASPGAGIRAKSKCTVINNTVRNNYYGIYADDATTVADNTAYQNTYGIYTPASVDSTVFHNVAYGSTATNYQYTSGNNYGPITMPQGTITNSSPWANLSL